MSIIIDIGLKTGSRNLTQNSTMQFLIYPKHPYFSSFVLSILRFKSSSKLYWFAFWYFLSFNFPRSKVGIKTF